MMGVQYIYTQFVLKLLTVVKRQRVSVCERVSEVCAVKGQL